MTDSIPRPSHFAVVNDGGIGFGIWASSCAKRKSRSNPQGFLKTDAVVKPKPAASRAPNQDAVRRVIQQVAGQLGVIAAITIALDPEFGEARRAGAVRRLRELVTEKRASHFGNLTYP
jgi:hypothetical protein